MSFLCCCCGSASNVTKMDRYRAPTSDNSIKDKQGTLAFDHVVLSQFGVPLHQSTLLASEQAGKQGAQSVTHVISAYQVSPALAPLPPPAVPRTVIIAGPPTVGFTLKMVAALAAPVLPPVPKSLTPISRGPVPQTMPDQAVKKVLEASEILFHGLTPTSDKHDDCYQELCAKPTLLFSEGQEKGSDKEYLLLTSRFKAVWDNPELIHKILNNFKARDPALLPGNLLIRHLIRNACSAVAPSDQRKVLEERNRLFKQFYLLSYHGFIPDFLELNIPPKAQKAEWMAKYRTRLAEIKLWQWRADVSRAAVILESRVMTVFYKVLRWSSIKDSDVVKTIINYIPPSEFTEKLCPVSGHDITRLCYELFMRENRDCMSPFTAIAHAYTTVPHTKYDAITRNTVQARIITYMSDAFHQSETLTSANLALSEFPHLHNFAPYMQQGNSLVDQMIKQFVDNLKIQDQLGSRNFSKMCSQFYDRIRVAVYHGIGYDEKRLASYPETKQMHQLKRILSNAKDLYRGQRITVLLEITGIVGSDNFERFYSIHRQTIADSCLKQYHRKHNMHPLGAINES